MSTSGFPVDRYKYIAFSSGDSSDGNKNKPVFKFQHPIDNLSDYIAIRFVQFPFTYYVFSTNYTSCTINSTNVTWPRGNYTPAEWISVVQPQLTNITIAYSNITSKLTFTHTLAQPLTITFSGSERAFELLGFNAGVNTGASPYVAPNVALFSGPSYVYLHSDFASVFNQDRLVNTRQPISPNNFSDVIGMIPITVDRNQINTFQESSDVHFLTPTNYTHSIMFYFTLGERTEILDFNGGTFEIILVGVS